MHTTADKLNLLLQTKADLKAALIEQGQDVTDETPFSDYADKVRAISGGGLPDNVRNISLIPNPTNGGTVSG